MGHKRGEAVCDRQGQLLGWIRAISRRTGSLTIETSTVEGTQASLNVMPYDIVSADRCPMLVYRLREGSVRWDTASRSFVGRAKDGTDVTLGDTPDSTERYLHTHPSSQDW